MTSLNIISTSILLLYSYPFPIPHSKSRSLSLSAHYPPVNPAASTLSLAHNYWGDQTFSSQPCYFQLPILVLTNIPLQYHPINQIHSSCESGLTARRRSPASKLSLGRFLLTFPTPIQTQIVWQNQYGRVFFQTTWYMRRFRHLEGRINSYRSIHFTFPYLWFHTVKLITNQASYYKR